MLPCQILLLIVLFDFANTTPMENASTSPVASSLLTNTSVFHIPAFRTRFPRITTSTSLEALAPHADAAMPPCPCVESRRQRVHSRTQAGRQSSAGCAGPTTVSYCALNASAPRPVGTLSVSGSKGQETASRAKDKASFSVFSDQLKSVVQCALNV